MNYIDTNKPSQEIADLLLDKEFVKLEILEDWIRIYYK